MSINKTTTRSFSFSIIVISIALSILGIALAGLLPVKLLPEKSAMKLEVSFNVGDVSPWHTETAVTSKIEAVCARVNGISEIESKSERNSGKVIVSLDKNSDPETVRFEVSNAIRQIWDQLPKGTSYPTVKVLNSQGLTDSPFIIYGVSANCSIDTIQMIAQDIIIPEIGSIDGVSSCNLMGVSPNIWEIGYSEDELTSLGLTPSDLKNSLYNDFDIHYLSVNNEDGKRQNIVVEPFPTHGESYSPDASWIQLNDKSTYISGQRILRSNFGEMSPMQIFRINGKNMVYCLVYPEVQANQMRLSSLIEEKMNDIRSQLPEGFSLHEMFNATYQISDELQTLFLRTILTVVLLLLFVAVVSKSFGYARLISISLFFNIAIAIIFYYIFDVEIQSYTLAAITISLNIIIDNVIVMAEHLMRKRDLYVFTSILAATLTTIGSLAIVFFLEYDIRITLEHFAIVIIINLAVSLLTTLFVIPALVEKLQIKIPAVAISNTNGNKNSSYASVVSFVMKHKKTGCLILLLSFGIPVFLLPQKINGKGGVVDLYNSTLGSDFYVYRIKPIVDVCTGGTLRLFIENVSKGEYADNSVDEPVLALQLTMPDETDISTTDEIIKEAEKYLTKYSAIRQVQSSIFSQRGVINIYFTQDAINAGLPSKIKEEMILYVQTLGAGTWHVSGVNENNFTNSSRQLSGEIKVRLNGYDYNILEDIALQIQDSISKHRRFTEPTISAESTKWKEIKQEYYYTFDNDILNIYNVSAGEVINALQSAQSGSGTIGSLKGNDVVLVSETGVPYMWNFLNLPVNANGKYLKLSNSGFSNLRNSPSVIMKKNQEYQLYLQVGYIGDEKNGQDMMDDILSEVRKSMPMGFSVEREADITLFSLYTANWSLLFVIITIIFFITVILFGNIRQSIAIILTIPISYIGLFTAFYMTGAKLDQGALAAFVLLSGLTVNMAIYIIDAMNELTHSNHHYSSVYLYVEAWRIKRKSICLTVISTILGFLPFMVSINHESFWFSLAIGTVGGLVFALIGILIYLPIFVIAPYPSNIKTSAGEMS